VYFSRPRASGGLFAATRKVTAPAESQIAGAIAPHKIDL
jgi:hypothetical protein